MTLVSADEAIELTYKHLKETDSFGTEIEAFLVRYLLVVICAEIEKSVLNMIVERVKRVDDMQLVSYVDITVGRQFRRIRTSEMGRLLGYFDKNLRTKFMLKINDSEEQVSFNNIVDNRHNMAHGKATVQMTFTELRGHYSKCLNILDEFRDILELDS